jgi:hypothetical protein
VARRTKVDVQTRANSAVRAPDGSLRAERLAALAAVAVAVLGWVLRRRSRRSERKTRKYRRRYAHQSGQ